VSRAVAEEDRRPLDAYWTPDPIARRLVGVLPVGEGHHVLEPHAGGGAFVRALMAADCRCVDAYDIDPTAPAIQKRLWPHARACRDFLSIEGGTWDWIVGNPPFKGAEEHVRHALALTRRHVVFLLRLAFLESAQRLPFWREHPARKVWVLAQRPSFLGTGGTDSAAYGWFWWDNEHAGPTTMDVLDMDPPRGEQVGLFGGEE